MKKSIFFLFLLIPGVVLSQRSADSLSAKGYDRLNKEYFCSYLKDGKAILLSPAHWKAPQWLVFGGTCAATAGLMLYADKDIKDLFQSNRSTATDNLSEYGFERIGSGLYSFPLVGLMYGYGYLAKKEKPRQAALLATKSIVFNSIAISAVKYAFQRGRPRYSDDPYAFYGPFGSGKNHSFASGHTSTAFTIATAIALEYRDTPVIPVLAYALATGVGLSRIHDNRHWASDVLFGAVLGCSISHFLYKNQFKRKGLKVGVL